jgi:hypothetical protein
MRGILATTVILHTKYGNVAAYPAGTQVEIMSNDDWYHDVQDTDINEALDLLEAS